MSRRTKSGKKTAVADVEDKLKAEYGGKPEAEHKIYGTLNKIGLKRGSKTTAKGMKATKPKGRTMPNDEHKLRRMKMPR